MSFRTFLSICVATLTQKPRYFPTIEWNKNCWTHNVFRAWEWLVGRRYGVRHEASAMLNDDGTVTYQFSTLEAFIAHQETLIRKGFKKWIPELVQILQVVPVDRVSGLHPWGIMLAVTYDSGGIQTTNGLTTTISFTITGTGIMLISTPFVNSNNDAMSTVIWNTTETLTKTQTASGGTIAQYIYLYILAGASTGAHSLVGTSLVNNHRNICASYSGSATTLDTSTKATVDNTATVTCSITTGVANTIIVAGTINNSGDASSSNGNVRQHNGVGFSLVDKSCASSGANSVTNTGGGFGAGTDWGYTIASIQPPPDPQNNPAFLLNFV
jgi:hypothetical protein